MENQRTFNQSLLIVAVVTTVLLLVPLVAMQFTDQVVWSVMDFVVAGALLFGMGISYVFVTRSAPNIIYRAAAGLGVGATLFMIWANLAVGLIGSGPNPGNLMYIGVVAIGMAGTLLSRLQPTGMARAMYAIAAALVLLTVIALLANMHQYPGSSVKEIIGVNGFFATPFVISGLLFRYAAQQQAPAGREPKG